MEDRFVRGHQVEKPAFYDKSLYPPKHYWETLQALSNLYFLPVNTQMVGNSYCHLKHIA